MKEFLWTCLVLYSHFYPFLLLYSSSSSEEETLQESPLLLRLGTFVRPPPFGRLCIEAQVAMEEGRKKKIRVVRDSSRLREMLIIQSLRVVDPRFVERVENVLRFSSSS